MGEAQRRSERFGEQKVSFPAIQLRLLGCPDHSRVSIPPEPYANRLPNVHTAMIQIQTESGILLWGRSLHVEAL
jgi:hypothetical protein